MPLGWTVHRATAAASARREIMAAHETRKDRIMARTHGSLAKVLSPRTARRRSPLEALSPRKARRPTPVRAVVAMCLIMVAAALSGCAQQPTAAASIQISTAYVNLPSASGTTEAYLVIQNNGSADRLTSARTSAGGLVTFRGPAGHGETVMQTVPDIAIPARAIVRLDPNSFHMLITRPGPMRADTEITLTLVFARAGTMSVAATVTDPENGGSSYLGD
jgi:copper(I)-binding protein